MSNPHTAYSEAAATGTVAATGAAAASGGDDEEAQRTLSPIRRQEAPLIRHPETIEARRRRTISLRAVTWTKQQRSERRGTE
jgi:hypothetical protein